MPLLNRNGQQVEDQYQRISDDAPVPNAGAILLPAARLLADADAILGRAGAVGVIWPNDRDVAELTPFLGRLALVALVFPTFRDGRAYSQARNLRERYRFRGELRATGDVLRDQFLFLFRAGFDAFEVRKPDDAHAFHEALQRYNVFYQPAANEGFGALHKRRNRVRSYHLVTELAS
jgi:uncharacterized protein (DUF934 family)